MPIDIRNLTYTYNKGTAYQKKAVDGVSLYIGDGEFVGLIGHTGSGKSTLVQQLNALLKPDGGSIVIDGEDIHADKSKLKAVRQKVGLVFQYPEHQLFEETVAKDVAFGLENMGMDKSATEERVAWALEMVGLDKEMGQKSPFDLSGGQKRRAAIAGVLAMMPKVLVLDEPAAGLDPAGRDEILNRIREMHGKLGITIILVSHSMEDVARLVKRIVVINNGAIAMDGPPGQVFSKPGELAEMGLSAPQAARLVFELRNRGFKLDKDIYTVEGAVDAIAAALGGRKKAVGGK